MLAVAPSATDPGGALDSGARPGAAQSYTVFRTKTVSFGGKELTVSSTPATANVGANIKAAPPTPPTGLEAVINTLAAPEIDLVWQPSPEAAGYKLYRRGGPGDPAQLTSMPVQGLSYSDTSVQAGIRYRYSVASVDVQGTEGTRSAEITESVPQR